MSSSLLPPPRILAALGERARQLRIASALTQADLAARAGVGVATVQRFEASGHASLDSVVRLAIALRAESSLDALFAAPRFATLDEAIAAPRTRERRRVRKRVQPR